jgi:hypothetical protein
VNTYRQSVPNRLPALLACLLLGVGTLARAGTQAYTVEAVNDPYFFKYPMPTPVRVRTNSYLVSQSGHEQVIPVDSTTLRNLSVTVENLGTATIRGPYLFGPHGWDFRSQEALARQTTEGAVSNQEKFFRVFEWQSKHMYRTAGDIRDTRYYGSSDVLFLLNKYGQSLCSATAGVTASLLHYVTPPGTVYGRRVDLHAHTVGEVFFDGRWQAFDTTFRWAYFGHDHRTPASWQAIREDLSLLREITPVTRWAAQMEAYYVGKATKLAYWDENCRLGGYWDLDWDLWPCESVTMCFDMRGRVDMASFNYNTNGFPEPRDYAAAVFSFRPEFANRVCLPYASDQANIAQTDRGLVPADPSKPAYVVFGIRKYPWQFCGADIKANFITDGRVYLAPAKDFDATNYAPALSWQLLSGTRQEYGPASIEGKTAYWVKFEFSGPGSGLASAQIDSEVQMSRWAMPALEYGANRIRFQAKDLAGSSVRVTYRYDDRSPYHAYEPATEDFGRHIPFRLGGLLEVCENKGNFWKELATAPNRTEPIALKIFKMTGTNALACVRTLPQRDLRPGSYTLYWNGRDDAGNRCPPNEMYAYQINSGGHHYYTERLYLFPRLWPRPNELGAGTALAPQ